MRSAYIKCRALQFCIAALVVSLLPTSVQAVNYSWTNTTVNGFSGFWTNASNWGGGVGFPGTNATADSVFITNASANITYTNILNTGLSNTITTLTISNGSPSGQAWLYITNRTDTGNGVALTNTNFRLGSGGRLWIDSSATVTGITSFQWSGTNGIIRINNGGTLKTSTGIVIGNNGGNLNNVTGIVESTSATGQGGTWNLQGNSLQINANNGGVDDKLTINNVTLTNVNGVTVGGGGSPSRNMLVMSNGAKIFGFGAISFNDGNGAGGSNMINLAGGVWTNTGASAIGVGANCSFDQLNIIDGMIVTNFTTVTIGSSGSGKNNSMSITNGSRLFTTGAGTIGAGGTGADSNQVLVLGGALGASVWSMGNPGSPQVLTIGNQGTGNRMIIDGSTAGIGGAIVTNVSTLIVGTTGGSGNNSVLVTNGGFLFTTGNGTLGNSGSSHSNLVTVAGTGSKWISGGNLNLGVPNSSWGNTLTISSGGYVEMNGDITMGQTTGAGASLSNLIYVTDAGSALTNRAGGIIMFQSQSVIVTNGGTIRVSGSVTNGNFNGGAQPASLLKVSGSNSTMVIGGFLDVGGAGGQGAGRVIVEGTNSTLVVSNDVVMVIPGVTTASSVLSSLLVSNAAKVVASNLIVNANNNGTVAVTITNFGGVLIITNSTANGGAISNITAGQPLSTRLYMGGSSTTIVDRLGFDNTGSTLTMDGGVLQVRTASVVNAFVVGNGVSAATLIANGNSVGSGLVFTAGITFRNNSTLTGGGVISGVASTNGLGVTIMASSSTMELRLTNGINFANFGTIGAASGATLTFGQIGGAGTAVITNTGAINMSGGTLRSGDITNAVGGVITGSGTITAGNLINLNNATVTVTGGQTFTFSGSVFSNTFAGIMTNTSGWFNMGNANGTFALVSGISSNTFNFTGGTLLFNNTANSTNTFAFAGLNQGAVFSGTNKNYFISNLAITNGTSGTYKLQVAGSSSALYVSNLFISANSIIDWGGGGANSNVIYFTGAASIGSGVQFLNGGGLGVNIISLSATPITTIVFSWAGGGTTNWDIADPWTPAVIPTNSNHQVYITNAIGANVTITQNTAAAMFTIDSVIMSNSTAFTHTLVIGRTNQVWSNGGTIGNNAILQMGLSGDQSATNATLQAALTVLNGGAIIGGGTITGTLIENAGGSVIASNFLGVAGSIVTQTWTAGATLNGNVRATSNSVINFSGGATLGGTATVAAISGSGGAPAALIASSLTMNPTGRLELQNSNSTATITGDLSMNGGAVVFNNPNSGTLASSLVVGGTFTNTSASVITNVGGGSFQLRFTDVGSPGTELEFAL